MSWTRAIEIKIQAVWPESMVSIARHVGHGGELSLRIAATMRPIATSLILVPAQ